MVPIDERLAYENNGEKTMKVYLLGAGGALSGARRSNTSFVVATERTQLLVECSGTPVPALLRAGLDPGKLDHLLISHQHPDHLYGLPSLIHQLYIGAMPVGRGPLTILGPEAALEVADRLLEAVGLRRRDNLFEIDFRPLPMADQEMRVGDLLVTTFPVDHNRVPTSGARIALDGSPERAMVSSADTQPCAAVVDHSQGAALLLHECSFMTERCMKGHTALGHIGQLASETTVPKIVLVHLPPMSEPEEEVIRADLAARFGDRVVLGEDGGSFEL
jgi:ribonuclease Z